MAYFLEYLVPSVDGDAVAMPVTDHPEPTIPLRETDAEVVAAPAMPVRTAVLASSVDQAKAAAEEILSSSKATEAVLYDDPEHSLDSGSGRIVASYRETGGWTER
jgi:hypothetical protein